MPEITECQKVRSEVTALQALNDNTIAVSTKLHGIRIFQADTCQNKQILSIAQLNHKTTAVTIHPTEKICAVANEDIIYIVSLTNKSLLQTIYTHNGTINILRFVADTPYLVSGTTQARVMLYRYDGHTELSRLLSFPNANVNAFAFSKNYIASSGYGACVSIIHLSSHKQIKKICASKVRVESLCFVDEQTLLFGNSDGTLYFESLENNKKTTSLHMPFTGIKNILHFPASDFALISGKAKNLALVNIKTKKIISPKYITFEAEIDTMVFSSEAILIVALKNRHLKTVQFANTYDLKTCILEKNIPKAFEIIDADPRFQGTKEHKRVEVLYKKLYAKAFISLINSNKKELQKQIGLIKQINSKTDEIPLLFKAYQNYTKFQQFYLEKKYALAYTLCEKFSPLKYTPQYKKMEADFKEAYTLSQKQILLGHLDIAKNILLPYITVLTKRPLINLLFRQNREFLEFLQALQSKNYKRIDMLLTKNEVFKDIPTYSCLQNAQKTLLQNIKNTINNADVDKAIQQIESSEVFTCNKELLEELYEYALSTKALLTNYENNDFKKCYELIDNDTRLQNLEITRLLEKYWQKLMGECEQYALIGDIQRIKERLNELLTIRSRAKRTGDLLRLSFFVKIKQLIYKNKFQSAENIIYSYIDIFGMDKEIQSIMKHFEKYTTKKLAITHEQKEKCSRDSWLDSQIL